MPAGGLALRQLQPEGAAAPVAGVDRCPQEQAERLKVQELRGGDVLAPGLRPAARLQPRGSGPARLQVRRAEPAQLERGPPRLVQEAVQLELKLVRLEVV